LQLFIDLSETTTFLRSSPDQLMWVDVVLVSDHLRSSLIVFEGVHNAVDFSYCSWYVGVAARWWLYVVHSWFLRCWPSAGIDWYLRISL